MPNDPERENGYKPTVAFAHETAGKVCIKCGLSDKCGRLFYNGEDTFAHRRCGAEGFYRKSKKKTLPKATVPLCRCTAGHPNPGCMYLNEEDPVFVTGLQRDYK